MTITKTSLPKAFARDPVLPVSDLTPERAARLSTCAASATDVVAIPATFAMAKPIRNVKPAPINFGKKEAILLKRVSTD